MRGGLSAPRPCSFTTSNDPGPVVKEAGWDAVPVSTGTENLAPTGIRSPNLNRNWISEFVPRLRWLSTICRRGRPDSFPGQFLWDSWWTNCHLVLIHLRLILFSHTSIIPAVLHVLFFYHPRNIGLAAEYVPT